MSYYQRNYSATEVLCICALLAIFLLAMFTFWELYDVVCSKDQDACSVYTRTLFKNPKSVEKFNISEIQYYKIIPIKHSISRYNHTSKTYNIEIYLKSGKIIHIKNNIKTCKRANEIYNSMIEDNEFILKDSYFKGMYYWY